MKIYIFLFKYFPFGGLQKDMLSVASECAKREHDVSIFCYRWEGNRPEGIKVNLLNCPEISNADRAVSFSKQVQSYLGNCDVSIAFDKIKGTHYYYAADSCFKAKTYRERSWGTRFLPRYRRFIGIEKDIFKAGNQCQIISLAKKTTDEYIEFYGTERERFHHVPPGISRDRVNLNGEKLNLIRRELKIPNETPVLLFIGSGFRTKGLDRAINVLKNSDIHLVIVGQDKSKNYINQVKNLNLESQVHFLGGRNDVPDLLMSADILIHPARRESAGMVLLEAAVAGLPVLTTENCGYSHYIQEYKLGWVVNEPFDQDVFDQLLKDILLDQKGLDEKRDSCLRFSKDADIYSLVDKIVDILEGRLI